MRTDVTAPALPEAGLRAEIRLLGQLLGEALREHEGPALYQLEESIRARTKALRQEYEPRSEEELIAELERADLRDAGRLGRAFATYFQLVNLAELERQDRAAAEAGGQLESLLARAANLLMETCFPMPKCGGSARTPTRFSFAGIASHRT